MVVEIKAYKPVLDVVIPVVDEFVDKGYATISTDLQPEHVGLAVDTHRTLWILYPYFKTNVEVKKIDMSVNFSLDCENPHGDLNIVFDERRKDYNKFEKLPFKSFDQNILLTILDCEEFTFPSKIAVSTKSSSREFVEDPLIGKIKEYIPGCLPQEKNEVCVFFRYLGYSGFPVHTIFQDFEPIHFLKKRCKKTGFGYPVSRKKYHNLKPKTWEFIERPVYHDGQGQWISQGLCTISGEKTWDDVIELYNLDRNKIPIKKGTKNCYKFIEALTSNNFSEFCKKMHCEKEYKGFLLSKPFKTFNKLKCFTHEGNVDYMMNIVRSYNNNYAKPYKKPEIRIGQLYNA